MNTAPFNFVAGAAPLLISIPHCGTRIPSEIAQRMTPVAHQTPDTDWHLERLYAFAKDLGASILSANFSRYVVDLNRPPDNANLYPGQNTTGLCPTDTFDSAPLYQPNAAPNEREIEARRVQYWQPYHDQLQSELTRLRTLHPQIILWDAHSIRSIVPRFFEGTLPALNFGTVDGASCASALTQTLEKTVNEYGRYSHVVNGRFKGGYITRQYGTPTRGVHAVQLEMAQSTYMQETPPFSYNEAAAANIAPLLEKLLRAAIAVSVE